MIARVELSFGVAAACIFAFWAILLALPFYRHWLFAPDELSSHEELIETLDAVPPHDLVPRDDGAA